MKIRRVLVSCVAIILFTLIVLVAFYGRIAASIFSYVSDTDISYKRVSACSINELLFKDLSIVQKKDGMGISSLNGSVKFVPAGQPWNLAADFALSDVHFVKKGPQKASSFNSIDGLISAPFNALCKYDTLSGNISYIKDGVLIRKLMASSDTIKFSFDGTITDDNAIDASITIFFADSLTGKMPPELSGMVQKADDKGWSSISFKVQGDLSKPSINVTGKMFRLNIGVKS